MQREQADAQDRALVSNGATAIRSLARNPRWSVLLTIRASSAAPG